MEGPPLENHALGSFSVWGPEAFQRSCSPSQRRVGQQTLPQTFRGPQLNPDPQASEQRSPLVVRRHPEIRARRALEVIWTVQLPHLIL